MTPEIKKIIANMLLKTCGIDLFDGEGYVLMEDPLWDIIECQRLAEREACAKIADEFNTKGIPDYDIKHKIARAIRASGDEK